jgi:hypothetical protein
MPRGARLQPGGVVFHVLNRGKERRELFEDAGDDDALVRVLADALRAVPVGELNVLLLPCRNPVLTAIV